MAPIIDFRSPAFLRDQLLRALAFHERHGRDPSGGWFHFFHADGTVADRETRELACSARFVSAQALAARHLDRPQGLDGARHGLRFLRDAHRDPDTGGYAWRVRWHGSSANYGEREVLDGSNHCEGLALVLQAHADALAAGIEDARLGLHETFGLMEHHFWEPAHGLYADEAEADWGPRPSRGQAANMRACEAMLAAHGATGELRFLNRAETLAWSVVQRLARQTQGIVREHYRLDWSLLEPAAGDSSHGGGVRPGHLMQWARLLVALERLRPAEWLVPRARELHATATRLGWDARHGGLCEAVMPGQAPRDAEQQAWAQAEALATSACLAVRTGEGGYWDWYDRVWEHCWAHAVDATHGGWHRRLAAEHRRQDDADGTAKEHAARILGPCCQMLQAEGLSDARDFKASGPAR